MVALRRIDSVVAPKSSIDLYRAKISLEAHQPQQPLLLLLSLQSRWTLGHARSSMWYQDTGCERYSFVIISYFTYIFSLLYLFFFLLKNNSHFCFFFQNNWIMKIVTHIHRHKFVEETWSPPWNPHRKDKQDFKFP